VQAWPEMKLQFARIFEQKTRNEWATGSARLFAFKSWASLLSVFFRSDMQLRFSHTSAAARPKLIQAGYLFQFWG